MTSPQTSQNSINGDTPPLPYLIVGIPAFLFMVWLTIWMGAILLDGCNPQPYSESPAIHAQQADSLDDLRLTLIKNQRENQQ